MLSPHELATLMLVKSCPDQIDLGREELSVLLEHRLIELERRLSGDFRPYLTRDGDSMLQSVERIRC
ncbi:hypothetical protein [Burkholderia guangdongensis]|uniref:hypothetical protein n=1 Tax=Burkholderia guangdongensis TaxID=1792500 RepID=UPI0015CCFE67|nr:hypothetical protein [Burkholderia guangdongensis]